jgi:hypothetical protein
MDFGDESGGSLNNLGYACAPILSTVTVNINSSQWHTLLKYFILGYHLVFLQ